MRFLLTLSFVFFTGAVFAQQQAVFYLTKNGKYVTLADSADYTRIVSKPDSGSTLYNISEFYKDGHRKLIGKSTTIDPPRFEGQCVRYDLAGNKQSLTNYAKGNVVGSYYQYYPNGKLYRALEYPDGGAPESSFLQNFTIIASYDSLGIKQVENGEGYYKGYDKDFLFINSEGQVHNGKKEGLWKGEERNLHSTFTETYKDGVLINGESVNGTGEKFKYEKGRATPPMFKGGVDAFGAYLGSHIIYPIEARKNYIEGRVILTFIVEKTGEINDVKVIKSVDADLDNEALRVIKNSPKWIPGTMIGQPVRVVYSVPVNFAFK